MSLLLRLWLRLLLLLLLLLHPLHVVVHLLALLGELFLLFLVSPSQQRETRERGLEHDVDAGIITHGQQHNTATHSEERVRLLLHPGSASSPVSKLDSFRAAAGVFDICNARIHANDITKTSQGQSFPASRGSSGRATRASNQARLQCRHGAVYPHAEAFSDIQSNMHVKRSCATLYCRSLEQKRVKREAHPGAQNQVPADNNPWLTALRGLTIPSLQS